MNVRRIAKIILDKNHAILSLQMKYDSVAISTKQQQRKHQIFVIKTKTRLPTARADAVLLVQHTPKLSFTTRKDLMHSAQIAY